MDRQSLGEAVLELVTDDAALEKGLAAAKSKTQGWASGVSGIATGAALAIAGVGAAATGILGAMSASAVSVAAHAGEVAKLKRELGLTAEQASRLSAIGKRLNLDTDELSKSFGKFSKFVVDSADKLKEYGIQIARTKDGHVDFDQTLAGVADHFKAMPDGVEKSALAMELFGKTGKELIPLLNQGRSGLKDLGDEAARLGLVFDDKALASAKRLRDAHKDLDERVEGLKNRIGLAFLPTLADWTGGLVKLADIVFPSVSLGLQKVGDFVGGLKEAFDKSPLHGFFDQVMAGAARLPAFLGDVIGSIGEIFDVLSGRRPSAGGVLRGLIGDKGAEQTMAVFAGVRLSMQTAWDEIVDVFNRAKDKLGPAFEQVKKWIGELAKKWDDLPGPLKQYATDLAAAAVITTSAGPAFTGIAANIAQIVGAVVQVGGKPIAAIGDLGAAFEALGLQAALAGGGVGGWFAAMTTAAAFIPVMVVIIIGGLIFIGTHLEDLGAIWEAFSYLVGRVAGVVGRTVGGLFDSIGTAIHDFLAPFGQLMDLFQKDLPFALGIAVGAVAGAIGEMFSTLVGFVRSAIDKAGELRDRVVGALGELAHGAISAIGEFVSGAIEALVQFVTHDVPDFLGSLKDALLGAGGEGGIVQLAKDAVGGFVRGLFDAIPGLIRAAWTFATRFLDGLRGALDQHSPSRRMAEIGALAAEGFRMGLMSGLPELGDLVGGLSAHLAVDTVPNVGGSMGAAAVDRPIQVFVSSRIDVDGRELARAQSRSDNESGRRNGIS